MDSVDARAAHAVAMAGTVVLMAVMVAARAKAASAKRPARSGPGRGAPGVKRAKKHRGDPWQSSYAQTLQAPDVKNPECWKGLCPSKLHNKKQRCVCIAWQCRLLGLCSLAAPHSCMRLLFQLPCLAWLGACACISHVCSAPLFDCPASSFFLLRFTSCSCAPPRPPRAPPARSKQPCPHADTTLGCFLPTD